MKFGSRSTFVVIFAVLMGLAVLPQIASAQSSSVQLTFYMLTANHSALGAPMQAQITLTNTGSTSVTLGSHVDLVGPDNTVYPGLLSACPTLAPGQVVGTPVSFKTSDFTTQTGTFKLQGYTTDICGSGTVVKKSQLTLTVVSVPTNGIYGSVGGRGPDTGIIGYTYDFETVVANLSASTMNLQTQVIMTFPDGITKATIKPGAVSSFNAGANVVTPISVTTNQYPGGQKTGTYVITVNVLDSSNTVLSTDTHSFTRTGLPVGFFSPVFKEVTGAPLDTPRQPVTLPTGCGVGIQNFNAGNSGAAIGDYDQDGFDDVFIAGEAGDNHLWRNNHDGTFADNAGIAGIPLTTAASVSGASFADIDNDGFPDLLLLGGPQAQPILMHNNGDGTFTDITVGSGLLRATPQNNMSATWGDYDSDGFLDLFIHVDIDCGGMNSNSHLYHNNGNNTFTDVSTLLNATKLNAHGLSAVFVDYNQDGRVDLYLGNDQGTKFGANSLWRNDGSNGSGGWIFTDVSASTTAGAALASMGIAVGDVNRDGQLDFYLTNFASSPNPTNNILLAGSSSGLFTQIQGNQQGGVHAKRSTVPYITAGQAASVTWGTGIYDFNNDGWEDIYMAGSGAGCVNGPCQPVSTTVLVNKAGQFLDLGNFASLYSTDFAGTAPAAVFLDWNNDGWMDVVQAPTAAGGLESGIIHLLTNTKGNNTNHWFQVKLIGTTSNRDAIGAKLVASVAGANLVRTVINGGTYQGNSTLIQQFGLGTSTQVDTLTITWPSGQVQTLTNLASDQRMTITEP